jgi:uncharacterized protein YuzE
MKLTQDESNDMKLLNYDLHKQNHLLYKGLFEKWIQKVPHQLLINELKRRKTKNIISLKEYDKENDIFYLNFGQVKESQEIKTNIIIDFDNKKNIVGLEIYDFMKELRRGV